MKRNVIISGDFDINELNNSASKKAVAPTKKAQERIDALKAAGVDVSNLYALGENMVVRLEDGKAEKIEDDDPIYNAIKKQGFVPDRRLFRRWVLAQMFWMLRDGDYTKQMQWKGYEYTWRMVEEELRVQSKLYGHDNENFKLRHQFFNDGVVVRMMSDYLNDLVDYINAQKVRHCKGVEYKRIYGRDIFVKDLQAKVWMPIYKAISKVRTAKTPKQLYEAVKAYNEVRVPMHNGTKQSPAWVDAYKGAGAYFSMQNLIRFHGMYLRKQVTNSGAFQKLFDEDAISYLNECAKQKEGWELLGMLKEAIEYNHIDIAKKQAEWSKD